VAPSAAEKVTVSPFPAGVSGQATATPPDPPWRSANVMIQETKRSGGTSTQRPPPAAGFFITHCLIMLTIRTIVASPGGGHRPAAALLQMTTTRNTPMNPVTPTSAMSRGGTFMRPGAMAWDHEAQGDPAAQDPATPAAIEDALATAVKDPGRPRTRSRSS